MPYIDPTLAAPEHVTEALTALEAELNAPIRVRNGQSANYVVPPWREGHLGEDSRFTLADAEARGITLVSYAAIGPARYRHAEYGFPGELYSDGNPRTGSMYDIFMPTSEPDGYELNTWNDDNAFQRFAAQIGERVVLYTFPVFNVREAVGLDAEAVFTNLIRIAADEDRATRLAAARQERERQGFVSWCQNTRNRALTDIRAEIERSESDATIYQQNLARAYATLRDLGARAGATEAAIALSAEDWMTMWEKLSAHPRITSVGFSNDRIVLTTDMITMHHPTHGDRTLGRFRIKLGVGHQSDITFENLDYQRGGRHHPHIPSDGNACWGDVSATIAKYMGDIELIGLVEMLFMFLESFNENDDWGRYAALWYDVPDALEAATPDAAHDFALPDDDYNPTINTVEYAPITGATA